MSVLCYFSTFSFIRFDLCTRIGDQTKAMFKGKVSAYAGQVEEIFSPAHVSLVVTNRDDIDEDAIKDKV